MIASPKLRLERIGPIKGGAQPKRRRRLLKTQEESRQGEPETAELRANWKAGLMSRVIEMLKQ